MFTETNTAPASPTRSDTLCCALSRTVSPCASMRPESDSPSTVVRSHDDRRASTSSESAEGLSGVVATGGGGVVGVKDGVVDTGAGVDGALTGPVAGAAVWTAAGSLPDRSHMIVPTRTAIPATPNNPITMRARLVDGTGTESMENGDASNVLDAAVDIEGACDDVDDIEGVCDSVCDEAAGDDGSGCCAERSVASENTLGSSGGGGSFAGSDNAWKGTVRASSVSASMSARASSSMPLTASSCAKIASSKSGFSIPPSVSLPSLSRPVASGRAPASPSAACTCAESTSSSRRASMTI